MTLDVERTRQYLRDFDFQGLFVRQLGWDRHTSAMTAEIDDVTFELTAAAQKRGLIVLVCSPVEGGAIPNHATRRKIERQIAKIYYEHILIFIDAERTAQIWLWARRDPGQPIRCSEHIYTIGVDPLSLTP